MKRIVVIGASAGGIEALRLLLGQLPGDFGAPIAIVVHTSPHAPAVLDEILDRAGTLPASHPRSGARLERGHVYVAPPDYHLVVEPGVVRLTRGPRENRFRPAVDPLFRTAAQAYGPGAIGVVLTGNLDDGTAGLAAIKQLGGTAVVQDPESAAYPSMPRSALLHVPVDHCLPVERIGELLVGLTSGTEPARPDTGVPDGIDVEARIAREENPLAAGLGRIAAPSMFACPECHGVLFRLTASAFTRYRCHTGHAYSAEALLASIDEVIEKSLWSTVRALEEGALLAGHMAAHAAGQADGSTATYLEREATRLNDEMDAVRRLAQTRNAMTAERRKQGT
ncbi:MAG TPA: chemotaxis protein CheB [Vicinamibacterales bacterium]